MKKVLIILTLLILTTSCSKLNFFGFGKKKDEFKKLNINKSLWIASNGLLNNYPNTKSNLNIKYSDIYYKIFEIEDLNKQLFKYNYFTINIFKNKKIPPIINDKHVIIINYNEYIEFNSKIIISKSFKKKILNLLFNNHKNIETSIKY